MKRLAALVAAVGMVLGALWVRGLIEGDDGGSDSDQLRVRCSTDLRDLCRELAADRDGIEVDVEDPGDTADALVELPDGEDPGFDVWLADAAWPAVVADTRKFNRTNGEVLGEPSAVLARSPVVLGVRSRPPSQVTEACGEAVDWRCVGAAVRAGTSLGMPSPDRGDGLVVLAGAVTDWFASDDLAAEELALNDFDDPGFSAWFDAVSAPVRGPGLGDLTPLEAGVTTQGRFAMVGALEADVVSLPRSRDVYDAIYPEPVVTADLVLVPAAGFSADSALGRLGGSTRVGQVLAQAGWRVQGQDLPEGANADVALPEEQGTPSPGVLQALRDRWED